jgi:flagellar export protein FliJ
MKHFTFTLQTLYDVQESSEKQVKMQMGAIEAEIAQRFREMAVLNASFDKAKTAYCTDMAGGVQAMRIKNYGYFFERIRSAMLLQQRKIGQLEMEKERYLQKLVQIRKEKMLLDKLREQQYGEYMAEFKKQQAKLMDDFVSYKTTIS